MFYTLVWQRVCLTMWVNYFVYIHIEISPCSASSPAAVLVGTAVGIEPRLPAYKPCLLPTRPPQLTTKLQKAGLILTEKLRDIIGKIKDKKFRNRIFPSFNQPQIPNQPRPMEHNRIHFRINSQGS